MSDSPIVSLDERDEKEGFSTQYGASASSPGGMSLSEREEDWFVSVRGEETEMEGAGGSGSGNGRDAQGDSGPGGQSGQVGNGGAMKSGRLKEGRAPSLTGLRALGGIKVHVNGDQVGPTEISQVPQPTPPQSASQLRGPPSRRSPVGSRQITYHTLLPRIIGGRRDRKESGRKNNLLRFNGVKITRKRCEDAVLLGAVGWGIWRLGWTWDERALAGEIGLLVGLSIIYTALRSPPSPSSVTVQIQSPGFMARPSSPATANFSPGGTHVRERSGRGAGGGTFNPSPLNSAGLLSRDELRGKGVAVEESDQVGIGGRGCVWGTEERGYRESLDDGALFALLLGPLVASAMLHAALSQLASSPLHAIPNGWMIEQPLVLPSTPIRHFASNLSFGGAGNDAVKALSALATSRRNLVQLFTLCSFVLLVQVLCSLRHELKLGQSGKSTTVPAGVGSPNMEREWSEPGRGISGAAMFSTYWLRRGELRRNLSVVRLAFLVTGACIIVKIVTAFIGHGVWSDMSPSDIIIATLFYQFSLYVCVRLAKRGLTLGELGVICNAATALFMETVNMTRMKIAILRTPYIKTYRLPTPLLTFQLALIPGSLLAGFLLSPLLYLSRHLAQKPAHRLRFPHEKPMHRRLLALGFYGGAALVCGGLVGTWARWCLSRRDPSIWVIYWLFEGRRSWTRPALISYWGALAAISVAGWNRQLNRARRHRRYVVPGVRGDSMSNGGNNSSSTTQGSVTHQPAAMDSSGFGGVASQMMDAADQRMPTLSVNARRKFFHALAVVMFVPGIAFDPAFTHLSFSVAFAAFTFAEYVRYFALWPFGVSVHLFFNEFLDHKDSGTAILSHFYLLAGCASPLWFEGPSEILAYFGVLSLGIGDALASIAGRRFGRFRWTRTSGKTIEGSIAFYISVVSSSAILWAFGLVTAFNPIPFLATTALTTLLEAFSDQNDNLILPMYGWALGTLLGV